eukprot:TRINITY_DN32473_c0_g1_i1.p1 TRINITY_DN32473_c0_g1~~TRINITY_DN32473_c0_g1_i1.p1  ORF type:complete len:370 (+),score=65.64 TRINITY_DN32473_c0_g1_i1:49-1158(+)
MAAAAASAARGSGAGTTPPWLWWRWRGHSTERLPQNEPLLATEGTSSSSSAPPQPRGAASAADAAAGPAAQGVQARAETQFLRRASSSLLGLGSQTTPAVGVARSPMQRQQARRLIQAHVDELLHSNMGALLAIFVAVVLLVGLGGIGVYLFLHAAWASWTFDHLPCDKPLKSYWWISASTAIVSKAITSMLKAYRILDRCAGAGQSAGFLDNVHQGLCVYVQLLGMQWLWNSKTCSKTNPHVYESVECLIYFQLFYAWVLLMIIVIFTLGMRRLALSGYFSPEGRGCPEAVEAMPVIDAASPELLDPEDGLPSDCVICSEELSQTDRVEERVVVRTRCAHCYHKDCLKKWLSKHVSCPICRTNLSSIV